jgi:hypothetical protein
MESIEMSRNLLLRLVGVWWAGVKVFLRWSVFWIALIVFWLPVLVLIYLVGEQAGRVLAVAFLVLCVPIIFYLTSRYLHLLGEDDRASNKRAESPSPATERSDGKMRMKIGASVFMAFLIGSLLLSPPDTLSQLFNGVVAALLCGGALLVLARFRFMKSASSSVQGLVAALVCLAAVLLLACFLFMQRIASKEEVSNLPAWSRTVIVKYAHEHVRHPWNQDKSSRE